MKKQKEVITMNRKEPQPLVMQKARNGSIKQEGHNPPVIIVKKPAAPSPPPPPKAKSK
jgi:hypothetical protein